MCYAWATGTIPRTIIKIKDNCFKPSYFIVLLLIVVSRVADEEKTQFLKSFNDVHALFIWIGAFFEALFQFEAISFLNIAHYCHPFLYLVHCHQLPCERNNTFINTDLSFISVVISI